MPFMVQTDTYCRIISLSLRKKITLAGKTTTCLQSVCLLIFSILKLLKSLSEHFFCVKQWTNRTIHGSPAPLPATHSPGRTGADVLTNSSPTSPTPSHVRQRLHMRVNRSQNGHRDNARSFKNQRKERRAKNMSYFLLTFVSWMFITRSGMNPNVEKTIRIWK